MKYLSLLDVLQRNNYFIFSREDLKSIFPQTKNKTLQNQLNLWIKKGYIAKLKRSVYELLHRGNVEIPDLYIANKLYQPSYISLETALSLYGFIPEVAAQVTSVTPKISRRFKNKYGLFIYRSIQPSAYQGYNLIEYSNFKIFLAEKEKALVDFFYFKAREGQKIDFKKLRLNEDILKKDFNWQRAVKYARLFNFKTADILKELQKGIE